MQLQKIAVQLHKVHTQEFLNLLFAGIVIDYSN